MRLSRPQALAEAMVLLDRYAGVSGCTGYYGAVVDASQSDQEGWERILASLVEAAKEHQRAIYRRWVLASHIDPRNWGAKCGIVQTLGAATVVPARRVAARAGRALGGLH